MDNFISQSWPPDDENSTPRPTMPDTVSGGEWREIAKVDAFGKTNRMKRVHQEQTNVIRILSTTNWTIFYDSLRPASWFDGYHGQRKKSPLLFRQYTPRFVEHYGKE